MPGRNYLAAHVDALIAPAGNRFAPPPLKARVIGVLAFFADGSSGFCPPTQFRAAGRATNA